MMKDWDKEILSQMDREAADYKFPMLNNAYLRGADIRLIAFSSTFEWLIIFQQIGVMEECDFVNVVSAYGNRLEKPGTQKVVRLVDSPPGGRIRDERGHLNLNMWDFTIAIKNDIMHLTPNKEDYTASKVEVDGDAPPSAMILRLLSVLIPEKLFLSDEELLKICRREEADLKKFLQLEDWCHPDVADDERPSQSPCLRSLALAIAMNDVNLYRCPISSFNTHWIRWEEIYRDML